jgi:drug/metabolite transporter (DMT)-like permease
MVVEGKRYPMSVWGSMAILIVGTALAAAAPNAEANLPGVLLCLGSVLCASGWTILSALLLQRPGAEKLDSISLVFVSSPTSVLCLWLGMVLFESRGLAAYFGSGDPSNLPSARPVSLHPNQVSDHDHSYFHHPEAATAPSGDPPAWTANDPSTLLSNYHSDAVNTSMILSGASAFGHKTAPHLGILYMVVGGLLGFGYDVIHNQFLKLTSALTMSIMGNTKLVLLIGLSMLILERPPGLSTVLGIVVALGGVFWYSYHKYDEVRQKAASEQAAAIAKETLESIERAKAASEETPLMKDRQSSQV